MDRAVGPDKNDPAESAEGLAHAYVYHGHQGRDAIFLLLINKNKRVRIQKVDFAVLYRRFYFVKRQGHKCKCHAGGIM